MPAATCLRMGNEGVPLWLIDDAHPHPAQLVEHALDQTFAEAEGDLYPGIRAETPPAYPNWLHDLLAPILNAQTIQILRTSFAVTTRAPASLLAIQRIPHFDTVDSSILAAVHYLCEAPHQGTSFYRHRATGFETMSSARTAAWQGSLAADAARHGMPPARYHAAGTAGFEQIGAAELRYNRLVLYPANCLHCGDIGESWSRDKLSEARLTITSLIRL
jgi:hypothetical protein